MSETSKQQLPIEPAGKFEELSIDVISDFENAKTQIEFRKHQNYEPLHIYLVTDGETQEVLCANVTEAAKTATPMGTPIDGKTVVVVYKKSKK